jgi:hypothetical protein
VRQHFRDVTEEMASRVFAENRRAPAKACSSRSIFPSTIIQELHHPSRRDMLVSSRNWRAGTHQGGSSRLPRA